MGFFSGLTLGGMTGAVGRMASGGGGPFGSGAPAPRQSGGDLLDRLRSAMDPERLAIAQAMIAGDYGAVSRMTAPLRQRRLAARAQASKGDLSKSALGATFDHPAIGDDGRLSDSLDDRAIAAPASELSPTAFQSHTLPWPDSPVFRGRSGPSEQGEEIGEGIVGPAGDLVAQETEAVRANRERYRAALADKGLNGWGYTSRGEQDVHDLARIMYAEAFDVPEDMPAVGWVALNRTGRPGYRPTIAGVIHQPGQFEPVREGNRRGADSRHWTRFDQPHLLMPEEQERRKQALGFAEAILSGRQFDLTGGATHMQAPYADSPWFARAVRNGRLEPLPYRSKGTHPHRHLFYREAAPPKDR